MVVDEDDGRGEGSFLARHQSTGSAGVERVLPQARVGGGWGRREMSATSRFLVAPPSAKVRVFPFLIRTANPTPNVRSCSPGTRGERWGGGGGRVET